MAIRGGTGFQDGCGNVIKHGDFEGMDASILETSDGVTDERVENSWPEFLGSGDSTVMLDKLVFDLIERPGCTISL